MLRRARLTTSTCATLCATKPFLRAKSTNTAQKLLVDSPLIMLRSARCCTISIRSCESRRGGRGIRRRRDSAVSPHLLRNPKQEPKKDQKTKSYKNHNEFYAGADLYVFRFKQIDGEWVLRNSKPCADCTLLIKQSGIKKVYYSTHDGVVKIKACDLESDHISFGRRPFEI